MARITDDAARHADDTRRTLIFLGDYIDRGTTSRQVVDRLLGDPLPGFDTVRLRGNHEEALLAFLDGHTNGREWLGFGGLETLLSYGVPIRGLPDTPEREADLRAALAAVLPPAHEAFYRRSSMHHCEGDYLFVHAGVRPGLPLERQPPEDLLWIRDDFLRVRDPLPDRVVVHGHTICDLPQDRGYRINIDTGAFASGRLTSLVLRGGRRQFMTTLDRT